jgi:Cu2+-exporting ATPase
MMTLIAIAITAAYAYSVYTTFTGGMNLFWELATLIAIMLIGHYIEMRAVQGAKGALNELAKLLPDTAEVIRDGKTVAIPVRELRSGDVVLVRPGAKVPADGEIMEGRSELNEAIITGESKPVSKTVGDQVIAGSINGDASLTVQVTNVGEKTFLAGIMRLVADAEASKSRLQMLSDRAAFWLTILAVGSALLTLIIWLGVGPAPVDHRIKLGCEKSGASVFCHLICSVNPTQGRVCAKHSSNRSKGHRQRSPFQR